MTARGSVGATPRYVEVVSYESGEVVKRLGPLSEWRADKVDGGLQPNLDHERYYTRIVAR